MSLIAIDDALHALLKDVRPLTHHTIPLPQALGRTLAQAQPSPTNYPYEDNSAMDGYALGPGTGPWRVVGEAAAGYPHHKRLETNEAVRIFTGGVLPSATQTVLLQEDALRDDDWVRSTTVIETGRHMRRAGSDLTQGQELLAAGRCLNAWDVSALASLGVEQVSVVRRPRVTIFTTGDELLPLGAQRQAGQLFDGNTYFLRAACQHAGAEVLEQQILADDREAVSKALQRGLEQSDLVLLSGGVSVGDHDHVGPAIKAICGAMVFWKVRMKPGKPVAAAHHNNSCILGLPGNPVSTAVAFEVFARPVIQRMLGNPRPHRRLVLATTCQALEPAGRRTEFLRARWTRDGVEVLQRQGSGDLSSMLDVDALVLRPAGAPSVPAGAPIPVLTLQGLGHAVGPEAQWEAMA